MMSQVSENTQPRTQRARIAILASALVLFAAGSGLAQNLDVTPDNSFTVTYAGNQGGPFTAQTGITWTLDDLDDVGLGFTVESDQLWVNILPAGGTIVGANTVDVQAFLNTTEANKLAPGNYFANITFHNTTNGVGSTTRSVALTVYPATFTVSPLFVNLSAMQGGNSPTPQTITLTNAGTLDLNYTLTPTSTNTNWFALSKLNGTVPNGGADTFDITFNTPTLAAGNYILNIDCMNTTTGVSNGKVVVTLSVSGATAGATTVTPDEDLSVTGAVGYIPGTVKTYTLTNNSTRSVSWSVSSSASWLTLSPVSGVLAPSDGSPGGLDETALSVRVSAAANTLAPGSFLGTVTFTDNSTSPASVLATRDVYLTVDPILSISPLAAGGAIVLSPAGTPVPGAGANQYEYPLNQVVTLQVNLNNLYKFVTWVGPVDTGTEANNPTTVTMTASKSIGATVTRLLRTLNMSVNGTGTGTIQPTPTGAVVESALVQDYVDGTSVSLSAQADAGAIFTGWTGNVPDGHQNDNPLVVGMDRDRNISASFQHIVHVNLSTSGSGTVAITPATTPYYSGESVTITATPADGFKFLGYSGDITSTTATLSVVLDSDKNIVANFGPGTTSGGDSGDGGNKPPPSNSQTFALTVQITGQGTVTPSSGTFADGATVQLVATPDPGSVFVGWSGDASGSDLVTNVTFTKDLQVVAEFAVDQSGGGTSTPTSPVGLCGAGLAQFMPLTLLCLAGTAVRRKRR